MGSQFSEEFLLGYRAGHRDGFADAVLLMRDAATGHQQALTLAQREARVRQLLSGEALGLKKTPTAKEQAMAGEAEGALTAIREPHRLRGNGASRGNGAQAAGGMDIRDLPERE